MAIEVIDGFEISKRVPANTKERVANEAAMLALRYPFKGLRTRRDDNGKLYEYIGDETSVTSLIADWIEIPTVHRGTAVPSNTLGVDNDIYIRESTPSEYYLKTAGAWVLTFNFAGAQILYTTDDPPSNGVGQNGDSNINTNNGKLWKKISGAWVLQTTLKGDDGADGDSYKTTSTQTIDLGVLGSTLTLTIVDADKDYTSGQSIIVANSGSNFFTATVDTASGVTLNLIDIVVTGTGSFSSWQVNLAGAPGANGEAGIALIHTESDITLNDAKVTAVESGSYTPQNPYSASVLNDSRSNLIVPAALSGSMVGKSISWNGTSWFNNGTWRGGNGPANTLSIGTVTTGSPGSSASASISGAAPNQSINLTIPRGDVGATGLIPVDYLEVNGTSSLAFGSTVRNYVRRVIGNGTIAIGNASANSSGSLISVTLGPSVTSLTVTKPPVGLLIYKGAPVTSIVMTSSTINALFFSVIFSGGDTIVLASGDVNADPTVSFNNFLLKQKFDSTIFGSSTDVQLLSGSDVSLTANTWSNIGSTIIDNFTNSAARIYFKAYANIRSDGGGADYGTLMLVGKGGNYAGSNGTNLGATLALADGTHILSVKKYMIDYGNIATNVSINGGGATNVSVAAEIEISSSFRVTSDSQYYVQLYVFPHTQATRRSFGSRSEYIRFEKEG